MFFVDFFQIKKDAEFVLNGTVFHLHPNDYVFKFSSNSCFSGFSSAGPVSNVSLWTFGNIWIGAYYTEFDLENALVGFAISKTSFSTISLKNYSSRQCKSYSNIYFLLIYLFL